MQTTVNKADESFPKLMESRRYISLFINEDRGTIIVNKCLEETPSCGVGTEVVHSHLNQYTDFHGEVTLSQ